jgi:hypothetical protein
MLRSKFEYEMVNVFHGHLFCIQLLILSQHAR